MDEFTTALAFFTPMTLLITLVGVFGGLVVGAMPGLTSTMAVALLVPITYGMSMELGIIILVAVYVGGISGGLVAAALLKIPGTPASVATTFDAYPMAQRGEAGRALAFGVFASFIGGLVSFFALTLLAPSLGKFALTFGSYEYFALVVFTLTCIISVSRQSIVKGLLSGCVGLFLSMVGICFVDGVSRFTFGRMELQAGFNVMPVLIGMYAISQIIQEVKTIHAPMQVINANFTLKEFWQVVLDCRKSVKNFIRSSLIGVGIGILPGIGPGLSNIVAYSQAKAADKNPDSFGQGNPDGIIASESANNAATGGAMIPLLTLGIPGDATTMMMLGAFMIHGVQPGPLLFKDNFGLVVLIFVAYFISNFFMLILQLNFIRVLIRALTVPKHILYPIILALCVIGSYALNSNIFDVWVFFAFGMVGYIMIKLDFPMLPLVLGLILGRMAEREFRVSYQAGPDSLVGFLDRPIALAFLGVALASIAFSGYKSWKARQRTYF